jgi:hypothetical protein
MKQRAEWGRGDDSQARRPDPIRRKRRATAPQTQILITPILTTSAWSRTVAQQARSLGA